MAKKDYPGLVIVPPSDRTILRRRLLRWSLLLIPIVWLIWTVLGSPPASQDTSDCQEETPEGTPSDPDRGCGRPNPVTVVEKPHENDVTLTQIDPVEHPAEPQHSVPPPPPENPQSSPEPTSQENPTPKPPVPKAPAPISRENPTSKPAVIPDPPKIQTGVQPNKETSSIHAPVTKPTTKPSPDVHLAEQGDAFAQYRLGKYYAKQKGQEAQESLAWYKKAQTGLRRLADAGNGQAMYVLGVMYAYGRGVAKNTEEARHWLSKAVRKNVTEAQPILAGLPAQPRPNHKAQTTEPGKNRKQ
ncbi:MAG: sel1 repeat family protein [Nitrospira sp.]|nr:sel1 repeat family protein [Nitrospira sp.]